MGIIRNPILAGFHPDPSICRAENRYVLAVSTFAWFPGVTLYESRDLARWTCIGSVLTRESQLPLAGADISEGIFAPTIRYYGGVFYLITTLMPGNRNFLCTARDPRGPWSEPILLQDAPGIDPSLFFDTDGTAWVVGQRNREGGEYFGDCVIWLRQLDLDTLQITGPETVLSRGFQRHAVWPEGPHLYRRGDWYYLIHAEGGTAFHHSVMAARSRNIRGPYEYARTNPILTHRHLGEHFPVQCVGHADLVEDGEDSWHLVCLGCRPENGYTLRGRETFLAAVAFEDGWPVVNPGIGRLEQIVDLPGAETAVEIEPENWTFQEKDLPLDFLSLRRPWQRFASLTDRPGWLRMKAGEPLTSRGAVSLAAVRAKQSKMDISCVLDPSHLGMGSGGLVLLQNERNHLMVQCALQKDVLSVSVFAVQDGCAVSLGGKVLPMASEITLTLAVHGLLADATCAAAGETVCLCHGLDLRFLSTEWAGGFVGCMAGLYAVGEDNGWADFRSLACVPRL